MKKLVLFTSIFMLLVLSVGTYYIYTENMNLNSNNYMSDVEGTTYTYSAPRVVSWGSTGQDVKDVQWTLLKWGYYSGAVDGIYGSQTYNAIRDFQRKNGLGVDGVVGPETAAALGLNFGPTVTTGAGTSGVSRKDDIYLLAQAVHGEARGESYIGKVAVAAVVLNRVKNPSFPNTIASVIYQPLAFTAVADGQINMAPDEESLKAARDAMNGWDPSYGCLYYWNPATSTSKWIWSRQVVVKIGKHWFGN